MRARDCGLLALFALSCGEGESVLVVSVTAAGDLPAVQQIRVTVSNGGTADALLYPQKSSGAAITFPTGFVILLATARAGTLDLALEALDGQMTVVGHGAARATLSGRKNEVTVLLFAGAPTCGNRAPNPGEECDDGNQTSGDGCDFQCRKELPPDAGTDAAAQSDGDAAPSDRPAPDGPVDLKPGPDVVKKANGTGCKAGDECASNFCADGFCCESACNDVCRRCDVMDKRGACAPIAAGTDPDNECTPSMKADCGLDGTCDGTGHCRYWDDKTECAPAKCGVAGNGDPTSTYAKRCDGHGSCISIGTVNCWPYRCSSFDGRCFDKCFDQGTCDSNCMTICNNNRCSTVQLSSGWVCDYDCECESRHCDFFAGGTYKCR